MEGKNVKRIQFVDFDGFRYELHRYKPNQFGREILTRRKLNSTKVQILSISKIGGTAKRKARKVEKAVQLTFNW